MRLRCPSIAVRWLGAMLLASLMVGSTMGGAWARDGNDERARRPAMLRESRFEGRAARQQERIQQRSALRAAQQRDPSVPAPPAQVERPQEAQQVDRSGRPGRLSPDERRALRQQINDAGRDIYRPERP